MALHYTSFHADCRCLYLNISPGMMMITLWLKPLVTIFYCFNKLYWFYPRSIQVFLRNSSFMLNRIKSNPQAQRSYILINDLHICSRFSLYHLFFQDQFYINKFPDYILALVLFSEPFPYSGVAKLATQDTL